MKCSFQLSSAYTCFSIYSLRTAPSKLWCTAIMNDGWTLSHAFLAKWDVPGSCHKTLYKFCRMKSFLLLNDTMLRKPISFFVHRNTLCINDPDLIKIMSTTPRLLKFTHSWSSNYKMSSPVNFFHLTIMGRK